MGYFSEQQAAELVTRLQDAVSEVTEVKAKVLLHVFQRAKASEYATHGICRRLDTLVHCSQRVFDLLAPSLEEVPEGRTVKEATVHVQSFVSNVIGVLDNIAWVWISERDLKHRNGDDFSPKEVKLSRDCRDLWRDLPLDFRNRVVEFRDWFTHASEWRDALVHRIPLYIPPFSVRDIESYNQLEGASYAALRDRNYRKLELLNEEIEKMKFFAPLIMHSFSENAQPNVFHANLVTDLMTVSVLIGSLMDCVEQLDSQ
ncbi:hypothetical protein [Thalassospira alkalitolerans]|uniref:Cthe-2314-like HEPN domain-containing protein n=1 Tax=Thalassospira alkalitolerans TaxID=1293890 RepID=A0A1Y2L8L6_9PROT|nr:hypothetical protein [Thalassospira alkalitolerans]OSQ42785.1 hypothetical protein TALK_21260 [Thalassospira alkalitolerans]